MGYDLRLTKDGNIVELPCKVDLGGSNYPLGGTNIAKYSTTYNYAPLFAEALEKSMPKYSNLIEKDTVLDDDYLIVDGTDGTKKAKKSTLLSDVNSRGALTAIYTSPKAITNTAEQITLSQNVNNFRKLIFFFGYTYTINTSTPIEIPVELFKAGYSATYSFAGAASKTCWGQAAYINDNTVSLVGSSGAGYDSYLLAVYIS